LCVGRIVEPLFPHFAFVRTHPPSTSIFTLSLHDALPIYAHLRAEPEFEPVRKARRGVLVDAGGVDLAQKAFSRRLVLGDDRFAVDRKSTRLNSSHVSISYAVFCLKKKKRILRM